MSAVVPRSVWQGFPPGSTFWLLAHELRLSLRAVTGRKGAGLSLFVLGGGLVLITLTIGLPLGLWLTKTPIRLGPGLIMMFDAAQFVIFTLILSQTLSAATTAFYERGDLDLLLASPLPPRRVLTARAVGVAVTPYLWFALFLTPVVVPLMILGQLRWVAAYLVLACLALLAAAAGLALAMGLFKLIGARATRTVGQLLAAVIGASFFLVSQARNFLPDSGRQIFGGVFAWTRSGVFSASAPLSWPARAVMGEPLALLAYLVASLAIFAGVTAALGQRFSADASVAAGVAGSSRTPGRAVTTEDFRGGVFSTMVRKELRLLARDPTLLSQVLLRTLYVIPLTFLLIRSAGRHSDVGSQGLIGVFGLAAGAGAVTFMAGQVAGSLAWITISAEDAPELIACAPVDGALVRRAKLTSTMVPVAALLCLPLAALLLLSPWIGICAALGSAASAAAAGLVNLWFEKPAPRKAFRSRRGGSVLGASAELLLGLGWGITAGMAAALSAYALIPGAIVLVSMGVLYGLANPDRAY